MTIPTIDELPSPAPTRDDPVNFRARADALMAALPPFVEQANESITELNAMATQIDEDAQTAAAAASQAVGAASVTKWISGTTYAEGDNRWSPIDFQTYRRKINGGGTTDPSLDTTNWELLTAKLPSRTGNARKKLRVKSDQSSFEWYDGDTRAKGYLSQSADVTLTEADIGFIVASFTVANKAIILPDATTLVGTEQATIKNAGDFEFLIIDAGGSILANLPTGKSIQLFCYDTTTVAGGWAANQDRHANRLVYGDDTPSANGAHQDVVRIGTNKQLLVYTNGSNYECKVVTLTKRGPTFGAGVVIGATSQAFMGLAEIGTDKVVFLAYNAGALVSRIIAINGTTPTVSGTFTLVASAVTQGFGAPTAKLDTDKFLFTYLNSATGRTSVVVTVSGTTQTIGSSVVLNAGTTSGGSLRWNAAVQVATDAVMVFYTTNATSTAVRIVTVSGTTPTANATMSGLATQMLDPTGSAINRGFCKISASVWFRMVSSGMTFLTWQSFTISGSSIIGDDGGISNDEFLLGYNDLVFGNSDFDLADFGDNSGILAGAFQIDISSGTLEFPTGPYLFKMKVSGSGASITAVVPDPENTIRLEGGDVDPGTMFLNSGDGIVAAYQLVGSTGEANTITVSPML